MFPPSFAGFNSTRHIATHRFYSGPGLSPHCLHTTGLQFVALGPEIVFKIKKKAKAQRENKQPSSRAERAVQQSQPAQSSAPCWGTHSPHACWLTALLYSRLGIQKQKRLFICYFSGELLSCSPSSTHLRAGMAAIRFLFKQSAVEAILEKEHNSCENNFCLGKCCC